MGYINVLPVTIAVLITMRQNGTSNFNKSLYIKDKSFCPVLENPIESIFWKNILTAVCYSGRYFNYSDICHGRTEGNSKVY